MEKKKNVLLIFLSIALIICLIVIFARRNNPYNGYSREEYVENLKELSDSVQVLQKQVKEYEEELQCIAKEREAVKQEISTIVKVYEKRDSSLSNGTWDDYIKLLTEYLSKKDSL